jgi:plasmid stabilization system protein ParE
MDVRYHRLAAQEHLKALRRYARYSMNVAERFVHAMNEAVEAIAANPQLWPKYDERYRWKRLRKFPYVLYFETVDDANVRILAVAHEKRRPDYWKKRRTRP